MTFETVRGWGRTPTARTCLIDVSGVDEAREVLGKVDGDRGIIVRGLGRSYGDAAQRSGGMTLRIRSASAPAWIDRAKGRIRCPAHVSIGGLVEFAAADGFFVPVTPGTRHVTIGGAVAADIHGKDHHVAGSFGSHVERLSLLLATGELVDATRDTERELFRATLGGMGLTGVIVEADISMIPVPGHRMEVDTFRTEDLESTMAALTEAASINRYSVAWVDLAASGPALGRGVVTNGDHTEVTDDVRPLRDSLLGVPPVWNVGVVNELTVRAFNEVWFRKAPRQVRRKVQTYDKFFYPLDAIRDWNRVYGDRGFLQYQLVLPFESESQLRPIVQSLAAAPSPVALAVLKGFGPEGEGHLSFPKAGWTLTADLPIPRARADLEAALRQIDEEVVAAGGRVYLAKDSRLGPDLVESMYPLVEAFRRVRDRFDPKRVFQSDLSARLEL